MFPADFAPAVHHPSRIGQGGGKVLIVRVGIQEEKGTVEQQGHLPDRFGNGHAAFAPAVPGPVHDIGTHGAFAVGGRSQGEVPKAFFAVRRRGEDAGERNRAEGKQGALESAHDPVGIRIGVMGFHQFGEHVADTFHHRQLAVGAADGHGHPVGKLVGHQIGCHFDPGAQREKHLIPPGTGRRPGVVGHAVVAFAAGHHKNVAVVVVKAFPGKDVPVVGDGHGGIAEGF